MIKICTDSCVDINKDQIEDNNISVLPLSIILGDKEYLDGVDITPKEIFAYVEKTGQLPKTAARSIEDFRNFFENLLKDGSEVIYMGISSKLSSAFNYACQAKEELQNDRLHIVDSKSLSTGIGLLVLYACNLIKQGLSCEEICRKLEKQTDLNQASFVVDKLDYLSRDAYFSGVPYGIQNTGYIISSLDLKGGKLVLEEDALLSVEHILFSKYMMYKSIYWHKGTRSATAMIKKALLLAIRDNVIKIEDLYFKDDKEFLRIAEEKKSFPPFSLIINAEMGHLFERKCSHPLSRFKKISENSKNLEKRLAIEDMLFALLKEQGEEIKSYEVIIDIPEPIKFENDMHILRHDGSISLPREGESIFFGENGKLFSENLRRLSIFLPENVSEEHLLSSLEKLEREL